MGRLLLHLESPPVSAKDARPSEQSPTPLACTSCGSTRVRANGRNKGIQRYWCADCGGHFSETTGKAVWNLKKRHLFGTYLMNMLMGHTIRKCAELTGLSAQTSFDWRHKALSAFSEAAPEGFSGIVESDDIFFLHSEKGSRKLERKPRKRGGPASKRGISDEQVAVVVTRDRQEATDMKVATRGRISKADLERVIGDRLEGADTLCTDSHRSYTAFAKAKGVDHRKFNARKGQRVKDRVYHVQNVNSAASRLRKWMRPFNGVATKYLQNYLNWFVVLESIKDSRQRLQQFAVLACTATSAWQTWKSIPDSAPI